MKYQILLSMLLWFLISGIKTPDSLDDLDHIGFYEYHPTNKEYANFLLCSSGMYYLRHHYRMIEEFSDSDPYPVLENAGDSGRYEIRHNNILFFSTQGDEIRYQFNIIDTLNLQVYYSTDSLFYVGDYIQRIAKTPLDEDSYLPCLRNFSQYLWEIYIKEDGNDHICVYNKWKGEYLNNKKIYERDTIIMLPNDIYRFNKKK
ncbi:hypothetical protein LJB78_00785 [Bacteroidales bacterium OttesenSCG-928-J16]|nr:hypothetical protein [Bacteroidales bacterium OttesenSCG-928-J16]